MSTHMRRSPLAVAAVVLAGLASGGCAAASELVVSPPTASAPSATPTAHNDTLPLDGKVDKRLPKLGDEMPAFKSPSGNIVCRLDDSGARCDIGDYAFTPPDRPDDCEGSWGGTLIIDGDRARFLCEAPRLAGNSPVLGYGRSTRIGDYGCSSQRSGVTCVNTETGHGFLVSRDRTGTF